MPTTIRDTEAEGDRADGPRHDLLRRARFDRQISRRHQGRARGGGQLVPLRRACAVHRARAVAARFQAVASFGQALGADPPLGADGGDHGVQLRRAALSPARPDRHHLLSHAAHRRGAGRASARRVGGLASPARHRGRLSRRAAGDASGLRHGALGHAAGAGGDARLCALQPRHALSRRVRPAAR